VIDLDVVLADSSKTTLRSLGYNPHPGFCQLLSEKLRHSAGTPAANPTLMSPCTDAVICTTIPNVVRAAAIGVPNITVTVSYPDFYAGTSPAVKCADRNCRVVVDAAAPFIPLPSQYLLGGAFQIVLKGGSQLVIQR